MTTPTTQDWRSKPRRPSTQKRDQSIGLKVTADEMAVIRANAEAAGMSLVDYIVARCAESAT